MFQKIKKRIKERLGVPSQSWSITNLKLNGFNPAVVYDIGAYSGLWTTEVKGIFTEANFYMFEGQKSKENFLIDIKRNDSNHVDFNIGLLGAEDGKMVIFNEYETASSVLTEHYETEAIRNEAQLTTLDTIVDKREWLLPDFIKLDTQGYELEILKGGSQCLKKAEVVLMEVSFIDIYKNSPLANDVIDYMTNQGFKIYDICTLMRRPIDNALFQADIIFVKANSKLLASKKWR